MNPDPISLRVCPEDGCGRIVLYTLDDDDVVCMGTSEKPGG